MWLITGFCNFGQAFIDDAFELRRVLIQILSEEQQGNGPNSRHNAISGTGANVVTREQAAIEASS